MRAFENLSICQTFPFTPKMLHAIISLSATALICPFLNPHSNIFINFRLSTVLRQTNILVCVSVIPALKLLRDVNFNLPENTAELVHVICLKFVLSGMTQIATSVAAMFSLLS